VVHRPAIASQVAAQAHATAELVLLNPVELLQPWVRDTLVRVVVALLNVVTSTRTDIVC
jgi:hypothetical protein